MGPFILTYSQLHTAAQEDFLAATFRLSFLTSSMLLWIFEQAEVSSLCMPCARLSSAFAALTASVARESSLT
jgi:hypothetical protein